MNLFTTFRPSQNGRLSTDLVISEAANDFLNLKHHRTMQTTDPNTDADIDPAANPESDSHSDAATNPDPGPDPNPKGSKKTRNPSRIAGSDIWGLLTVCLFAPSSSLKSSR